MTREDAYFIKIMLMCGYADDYDYWLNYYLETERPLSGILLELIDCKDNINEVLYRLNSYCNEKPFDEEAVYARIRLFLRDEYKNGKLNKDDVISTLFLLSQNLPDSQFQNQCNILSDCCNLAKSGIFDMEKVDAELTKWLDQGSSINGDLK